MTGKQPHNMKSRGDDWYLQAWAHTGVTSSVLAKTTEDILQNDHRGGSLKETPILWMLMWSHLGGKRKVAGKDETMGI